MYFLQVCSMLVTLKTDHLHSSLSYSRSQQCIGIVQGYNPCPLKATLNITEWGRKKKNSTFFNCMLVPDNWWNSGYIHVLLDELWIFILWNKSCIHLCLISIHTLLELWVDKDTFPNYGNVWSPYPATEETHHAWALDLPFSPELIFHVEAAIYGSPGTCFFWNIGTTCEIFGPL